jgi:hypothetical protein
MLPDLDISFILGALVEEFQFVCDNSENKIFTADAFPTGEINV